MTDNKILTLFRKKQEPCFVKSFVLATLAIYFEDGVVQESRKE